MEKAWRGARKGCRDGVVGFLTLGLNHIGLTGNVVELAVLVLDKGLGLWLTESKQQKLPGSVPVVWLVTPLATHTRC